MHPLIQDLAASPDVFIHQFDVIGDRALLIRMTAEQRRQASFLDERILGPAVQGGWAPWSEVGPAARRAPASEARFIFHIGHCGSTLISRLIEDAVKIPAFREPLPLRTFAQALADLTDGLSFWTRAEMERRLDIFLRTMSVGAPALIKATSFCNALAEVHPVTEHRTLFCFVAPETYIATMLGGANNPTDLRHHAAFRLRRLRGLCGGRIADLASLSPGELCAMSWGCETATAHAAMDADKGNRIVAVDFDRFLAAVGENLAKLVAHLGLAASPGAIDMAQRLHLPKYSKDASFDYSPADRTAILADYRRDHQGEVRRGMAWLEARATEHTPVASALARLSS